MDKFIWNTPEDEQEYGLRMSYEHWIDLFKETGFEVVVAFKSLNSLFLVRKSRAVSSGSLCVVPEQRAVGNRNVSMLSLVNIGCNIHAIALNTKALWNQWLLMGLDVLWKLE